MQKTQRRASLLSLAHLGNGYQVPICVEKPDFAGLWQTLAAVHMGRTDETAARGERGAFWRQRYGRYRRQKQGERNDPRYCLGRVSVQHVKTHRVIQGEIAAARSHKRGQVRAGAQPFAESFGERSHVVTCRANEPQPKPVGQPLDDVPTLRRSPAPVQGGSGRSCGRGRTRDRRRFSSPSSPAAAASNCRGTRRLPRRSSTASAPLPHGTAGAQPPPHHDRASSC